MNIGIYIYDQAEVLDFSGPFEVFTTATRLAPEGERFKVFLVGETGEMVTARGGFQVLPMYGFHNVPQIDVLLVPGGVHTAELSKPAVIDWIAQQGQQTRLTASVCTGAFLLAEAQILTTHTVTTHWEDIPDLQTLYSTLTVLQGRRWVDEGAIITSAGISAGIDMSLHLVSKLRSLELAERTARQMEFDWTKNS